MPSSKSSFPATVERSWTDSLTMVLDSHADKLDQTGVKGQTEINSHSEKLELLVDFIYEQF